ncbi:MAG: hypothetical protein U0L11_06600 [Acutalibacteraceae bacterium]|nr:hypothetical protein [Acutalibacteraceae bacterium]
MKKNKITRILSAFLSAVVLLTFVGLGAGSGKKDKTAESVGSESAEQIDQTNQLINKITFLNDDGEIINYRLHYYNDNGLLREEKIYTDEDDFVRKLSYEYDELGRKISFKDTDYNGNILDSKVYEYDEYGNDKTNADLEYDSNQNIIKEITYHDDGKVYTTKEYEYDENGNVVKETSYIYYKDYYKNNSKPVVPQIKLSTYDANGNLIKRRTFYDDNKNGGTETTYEYSASGKLTKKIVYNCYKSGNIETEYCEFEYNSAGDLTRAAQYGYKTNYETNLKEARLENEYTYTYNDSGCLIYYTEDIGDYKKTDVKIEYADTFISSPTDESVISDNQEKIVHDFKTPAIFENKYD